METTGISTCLGFVALVLVMMGLAAEGQGGLKTGFYSSSCPKAEDIVRSTVEAHFNKDPSVAAGLLRLHFHDCFVQVPYLATSFFQNSNLILYFVINRCVYIIVYMWLMLRPYIYIYIKLYSNL